MRMWKLSQLYLSTNTCAVMEVKHMCSVKLGNTICIVFSDNMEFYLCTVARLWSGTLLVQQLLLRTHFASRLDL